MSESVTKIIYRHSSPEWRSAIKVIEPSFHNIRGLSDNNTGAIYVNPRYLSFGKFANVNESDLVEFVNDKIMNVVHIVKGVYNFESIKNILAQKLQFIKLKSSISTSEFCGHFKFEANTDTTLRLPSDLAIQLGLIPNYKTQSNRVIVDFSYSGSANLLIQFQLLKLASFGLFNSPIVTLAYIILDIKELEQLFQGNYLTKKIEPSLEVSSLPVSLSNILLTELHLVNLFNKPVSFQWAEIIINYTQTSKYSE